MALKTRNRKAWAYCPAYEIESNLNLRVDQQILRFDISMNDIAHVTKCYSLNHLVYEESETFRVDSGSVLFEHLQEIFLNILKHKVEPSFSNRNQW